MAISELLSQGRQAAQALGLPVERAEAYWQDQALPLVMKKLAVNVIGFVRRSGLKILDMESGRVVCRMPLKSNVNHFGTMYAGALFTLAEFPGGALFVATFDWQRYIPIVTELKMEFVHVAKGAVDLEVSLSPQEIERIESELQDNGRSAFELHGELKTADGTVVARSHAKYLVRPKRS